MRPFESCQPRLSRHAAVHAAPLDDAAREGGKEFHGLQAIYAQPVEERGFRGTEGEELSVIYSGSTSFQGGVADVRFVPRETGLGCERI